MWKPPEELLKFVDKIEQMSDDDVNKQQEEVMKLTLPLIKTVNYYGDEEWVEYKTEPGELGGLCPMTALPDGYVLTIKYIPNKVIPELKSLKIYLLSYRLLPIFHENLASKIFNDFNNIVKPKKLELVLDVNVRGGIKAIVSRKLVDNIQEVI